MIQSIKIALIGATGKAGEYILQELLNQGFNTKVLIRNPETFQINHPNLEIIKGDARNKTDLQVLLSGCQALISALGQTKGEIKPVFSDTTKKIIQELQKAGIQRYILLTGLQVDTPRDKKKVRQK